MPGWCEQGCVAPCFPRHRPTYRSERRSMNRPPLGPQRGGAGDQGAVEHVGRRPRGNCWQIQEPDSSDGHGRPAAGPPPAMKMPQSGRHFQESIKIADEPPCLGQVCDDHGGALVTGAAGRAAAGASAGVVGDGRKLRLHGTQVHRGAARPRSHSRVPPPRRQHHHPDIPPRLDVAGCKRRTAHAAPAGGWGVGPMPAGGRHVSCRDRCLACLAARSQSRPKCGGQDDS